MMRKTPELQGVEPVNGGKPERRPSGLVRRLAGCRRGGVAVEFALLMPLMLVLFLALYDFGMAAYENMSLTNAARVAGQYGVMNPLDSAGITAVATQSQTTWNAPPAVSSSIFCQCPDGTSVDCSGACAAGPTNHFLRVLVQEPYQLLIPYPGLSGSMNLAGEAVFRLR